MVKNKYTKARIKSERGGLLVAVTASGDGFRCKTVHPDKFLKGKQLRGCVHHVGGISRGARLTSNRCASILKAHSYDHQNGRLKNGKCRHHVANWKQFVASYGGVGGISSEKAALCQPVVEAPVEAEV